MLFLLLTILNVYRSFKNVKIQVKSSKREHFVELEKNVDFKTRALCTVQKILSYRLITFDYGFLYNQSKTTTNLKATITLYGWDNILMTNEIVEIRDDWTFLWAIQLDECGNKLLETKIQDW